jgi:peptidoglycan/xylan/chitin deacetylase (PgdA/CDA1 family)
MSLITSTLLQYYRRMQARYPDTLWFGDQTRRTLALTFDDGPHPLHTQPVLDTLKKYNVPASFFLLGHYVDQFPHIVEHIHAHGHGIGLHGYRHRAFPLEQPDILHSHLTHTRQRIAEICGTAPETLRYIRPPYGAFNHQILALLKAWGYTTVLWNNLPPHWMQPLAWTINQTLEQATPGGVIVLHDGHGHGTQVARILESLIPALQDKGFEFVTVEQMETGKAITDESSQHQHRTSTFPTA